MMTLVLAVSCFLIGASIGAVCMAIANAATGGPSE
jgi:hypothetical protein